MFVVSEGKLLGHIVNKEGIFIDPKRIKAINKLNPPSSKKWVQSFFGKINFVRRFVPNDVATVKPINKLLKKDQVFEWSEGSHKTFLDIKLVISAVLVLISPNLPS